MQKRPQGSGQKPTYRHAPRRRPDAARPPAATRWSAVARTSASRRAPRPAPAPPARRRIPAAPLLGVAVVALLAFVMVPAVGGLFSNTRNDTDTPAKGQTVAEWRAPRTALVERLSGVGSTVAAQAENPPRYLDLGPTKTGEGRVSFSAVGDNLFNENLLDIADAAAGVAGDGKYGFDGFYRKIKKKIASYDISFVNQETTLGGPDRYGYNGYPSYNTPDALAPVVAKVGWDVVNTNSNHTYDTWVPAIEHAQGVWNGLRDKLLTIGSFANEADRQAPRIVSCNGLRIAFLSYSYGQNGYTQADLPNAYFAVPYDVEVMREDVVRSRAFADAVVVYLHAGIEYEHEPSETQRQWAQECVDAGVDLVIGSHVHVIQSMELLEAPDGQNVLAVYGLGDFLSGYHNNPDTIMSGLFSCVFERVDASGTQAKGEGGANRDESKDAAAEKEANVDPAFPPRRVRVTKATWTPLIEHWENGDSTVRTVKGYADELARRNELLAGPPDPLGWIRDTTNRVIGEDFEIDM